MSFRINLVIRHISAGHACVGLDGSWMRELHENSSSEVSSTS